MITIVDLSWKKDSLSSLEFVEPVRRIAEETGETRVLHISEIDTAPRGKIILCGTALQDNGFLDMDLGWIRETDDVLGICAGMQAIAKAYGAQVERCEEIGMVNVSTVVENPLFIGEFRAYAVHANACSLPHGFDMIARSDRCIHGFRKNGIYGILFHPEVRNEEVLRRFLKDPYNRVRQ